MADTLSEALLVSTSWNTASDDLTSQPTRTLVKDFCENTLKSDEVSKLYCTVLDVEVSEDQKKDAESVGVTLIPATRDKWSDPEGDPPAPTWLVNHDRYYPRLKELQHIKHVVSFSPKTKNAAAAIHESIFPQAQLHQLSPPERNGVLFTFDIWNKDACGLTNYHRTIIHDFCVRKAKAGEHLTAYSTVIDVELSEDQTIDAKKCGVTLIPAQRKKGANQQKLEWLMEHQSRYPDLCKLENIKYVVGYAPKTGWAAADIREKLFPHAKLVLINHALPETNCLCKDDGHEAELEDDMLEMAREADMLFSIGPKIYEYFENAYRANIDDRQLSDIPHEEILPKPGQVYFDSKVVTGRDTGARSILTYGQLDTEEALKTCESIAASIGNVANAFNAVNKVCPDWKIKGFSEEDMKKTRSLLTEKLNSAHVMPKLYPTYSVKKLLQVLQQSHLCLPPSCYTDYSFEGLEAMAAGLPTRVQDDSHIACMIEKHFPMHTDLCVMTRQQTCMDQKISRCLTSNTEAFDHAKILKEDFSQSEVVTKSLAKFASVFKEEKRTKESEKHQGNGNEKEKGIDPSEDTHRGMSVTNGIKTKENTTIYHGISVSEGNKTTDSTAVHDGVPVSEDIKATETSAVQPVMSITEDVETREGTIVKPGMTIPGDINTSKTIAEYSRMSVTDAETLETRAAQSRISVTGDTATVETTTVQPQVSVSKDKQTFSIKAPPPGISLTHKETTESTAVQSVMSVKERLLTEEITAVQPGMSVKELETIETAAVQPRMSVKELETIETTAVQPGMSAKDLETKETTAVQPGMSVKGLDTIETTAVQPGMSVKDLETIKTTEVQPGMSVKDLETIETTAVQPRMSVKDLETIETTEVQPGMSVKDLETIETTAVQPGMSAKDLETKQATIEIIETTAEQPGMSVKYLKPIETTAVHFGMSDEKTTEISGRSRNPPPPGSTTAEENTDSNAFTVHVGLDEESYQQQMRDLDSQVQTKSVREKKEQLKAAWEKIQAELDKTESEVITNNTSLQRVDQNCRDSFGEGTVTMSTKRDSLAISLDLPTLYNLYRLKQTCLSGSFPDSFEPLLITDKMREEADKVGLQLKLKATYDQARFDELELFFINRDGGGLEPVIMYHDVIEGEDDEEILTDDEDIDQKSHTMVTGRIDNSSQTEQGQSIDDIQYTLEMERRTLESQLKAAKEEKGTLEDRCKELTQKLESSEQSMVSQRIGNSMEKEKLQSERKENQKLIKELQDKVAELEHQLEQSDLKKQGEKGDWSVTLVNGQHKDQGQKFKRPRGLAFHRDKLVVCDSGNNIVQILNKDYTCDKVIGSFDGQFAKPFRPLSVAISRFNHYFILDDENKQIVVCDENGKIIKIITLPVTSK
ncbi:uro-adherence factor A-like [Ptychodera flava]|uniref:uro-adherence factor A-like n=1 Tax=Ptychodera flava TaxID=63121 RepID=UPI00396A1A7F